MGTWVGMGTGVGMGIGTEGFSEGTLIIIDLSVLHSKVKCERWPLFIICV